ncbi:MAG TPA: peroxide stress protein YaaA [Candidatus Dojkabacteria bacterium]|jgi:hypothetical protein
MLIITSPAKRQDFEKVWDNSFYSIPEFPDKSKALVAILEKYSVTKLQKLFGVSTKLAELNAERFRLWSQKHTVKNSKPAILAYKGDIYRQFDADGFDNKEREYAQRNLRIITGLYGILNAYDLIQPYRLEMKIKLRSGKSKDLYSFWQNEITGKLNSDLKKNNTNIIINLASHEYADVVDRKKIQGKIVDVNFRQLRKGRLQNIGIIAKISRGEVIDFMIQKQVKTISELKKFNKNGYKLSEETDNSLTFTKKG